MQIGVHYDFLPKQRSVNAAVVMDHFGIDFEQGRHVIAEGLQLPIAAGDVVLFSGPSGSGKSSLMRAAAEQLAGRAHGTQPVGSPDDDDQRASAQPSLVIHVDLLDLPDRILADALALPVEEALSLFSLCGLSEAQLLLRTPAELSDGQRYRFRLALALAQRPAWIVADEFTATLDRTLAKVVAFNIRRLSRRTGTGFLLATTHEDVIEDLNPDVLVRCDLDGNVTLDRRDAKKNESALPINCGSAQAPSATGRISLGGIIAATTSVPRGG